MSDADTIFESLVGSVELGDPLVTLRTGISAFFTAFGKHRAVTLAGAAAKTLHPEFQVAWSGFIQRWVDYTALLIAGHLGATIKANLNEALLGGWVTDFITPVTSGRPLVRSIKASMSRSTYMLMALAPPADSVPPTTVANISQSEGIPRSATIIVGTVLTNRSSMMRGLVRAT